MQLLRLPVNVGCLSSGYKSDNKSQVEAVQSRCAACSIGYHASRPATGMVVQWKLLSRAGTWGTRNLPVGPGRPKGHWHSVGPRTIRLKKAAEPASLSRLLRLDLVFLAHAYVPGP